MTLVDAFRARAWLFFLVMSACSVNPPVVPQDGGTVVDGGLMQDGGPNTDGGGAGVDGGVPADAGPLDCPPGPTVRPAPRAESAGAFDTKRGRLVFVGGDDGQPVMCNPAPHPVGEVWTYRPDCGSFEQLPSTSGPGPRARAVGAYDKTGDRVLVFGGRYRMGTSGAYQVFNDVWAYSLTTRTWAELSATTPTPKPAARSSAAGAFNDATRELIVYAGNTSTDGAVFRPQKDVWAFNVDTARWRTVTTSGGPTRSRLFHAAALDAAGNRLFIYGGGGANAFTGPFYGDLWVLELATGTWMSLADEGAADTPLSRIQSALVYDGPRNRLVLFGGHDDGAVGNQNDTWSFDLEGKYWTALIAPEEVQRPAGGFCNFPVDFTTPNMDAPDRRALMAAAHDDVGGRLAIFGGRTDCGIVDDAWAFNLATDVWQRGARARFGEACVRGPSAQSCNNLCQ